MNKKLTLLASSLLALLLSAGQAWAGDLSDASLHKLLDLSGVNQQAAALPAMIKGGARQAQEEAESSGKEALSKQDYKELQEIFGEAFQPGTLLQAVAATVSKNVSEADAKQVLAWLESDVGRKITQAEVDATNDEARGNMMNDTRALMADKERVELARKLDKLQHTTDDAITIEAQMATVMYVSVSRRLRPDQPVDEKAFRKQVMAGIDRASVEQATLTSFVYTYRNIDIPSLKKYIEFLEQPAARRFNDSLSTGLIEGMNKCAENAAEKIAAAAKKKKRS